MHNERFGWKVTKNAATQGFNCNADIITFIICTMIGIPYRTLGRTRTLTGKLKNRNYHKS